MSLFEAPFTRNNVTIMYYEEISFQSLQPNWAPSNEGTPLISKTFMRWKPQGNNEPATIRKYANFTCRFVSSDGKKVVTTQGRLMTYPYPGANCSVTTTNSTGSTTTTTTSNNVKACEKLENAVFCKSPDSWVLPDGMEKEDIQM